jgi:hypothetical protein
MDTEVRNLLKIRILHFLKTKESTLDDLIDAYAKKYPRAPDADIDHVLEGKNLSSALQDLLHEGDIILVSKKGEEKVYDLTWQGYDRITPREKRKKDLKEKERRLPFRKIFG